MVACRFFQQGCCRYGDNCRFEHVYGQKYTYQAQNTNANSNSSPSNLTTEQLVNSVVTEVNIALKSNQWVLSVYGPFKNKPNLPGLEDISPEELRLSLYESRTNGTIAENQNQIAQLYQNNLNKLKALTKPTSAISKAIETIYRGEIPSDPFVSTFGNAAQSINPFGSTPNASPNVNLFGGGNQNALVPNVSGNLFANAAQNLFQNASNTMFGAQASPSFGTNNVFSPQPEIGPSSNPFGGTAFASGFKEQQSPFGINNTQIFNSVEQQPNNVFGNSLAPINSATPAFGQIQSEISPSALFGAANANLPQSTPTNVQSSNIFGQQNNASVFNQNPFGVPAQTAPFNSNGINVNSISNTTNLFGNQQVLTNSSEINDAIYSKTEELSQEELAAFHSETFHHGFIPEVAPPASLCV